MSTDVVVLDEVWAKEITWKIQDALDGAYELIVEATKGRAWEILGYAKPEDYWKTEFPASPLKALPAARRKELVQAVKEAVPEITTRALGAAVGVDQSTVVRDLDANASDQRYTTDSEVALTRGQPEMLWEMLDQLDLLAKLYGKHKILIVDAPLEIHEKWRKKVKSLELPEIMVVSTCYFGTEG